MIEVLVACAVYALVVYPSIKVAQAVRRGDDNGTAGYVILD